MVILFNTNTTKSFRILTLIEFINNEVLALVKVKINEVIDGIFRYLIQCLHIPSIQNTKLISNILKTSVMQSEFKSGVHCAVFLYGKITIIRHL